MWVCLNDAFFSIVDEKAKEKKRTGKEARPNDVLVVRARRKGELELVFEPHFVAAKRKLQVTESAATDYRYRLRVTRGMLKDVMAAEVDRVIYGNFKDSVADNDLHHAYSQIWQIMFRLQEPNPRRTYGPSLFGGKHA